MTDFCLNECKYEKDSMKNLSLTEYVHEYVWSTDSQSSRAGHLRLWTQT